MGGSRGNKEEEGAANNQMSSSSSRRVGALVVWRRLGGVSVKLSCRLSAGGQVLGRSQSAIQESHEGLRIITEGGDLLFCFFSSSSGSSSQ